MTLHDLKEWEYIRVTQYEYNEHSLAATLLQEYLEKSIDHTFAYQNTGNFIEDLLNNYFLIKGTENEKILTNILESHGFNYSESIHNAMYYLLGQEKELKDLYVEPVLWPGVNAVEQCGETYRLHTVLGDISVFKATQRFTDSASLRIFKKPLMGYCHDRSYEFLKKHQDFQAVLAYMPNFFYGGHYHAYLEKDSKILDIASNAYYTDKESIDKLFNGEIIAKVSYEKIEEDYRALKKEIPELDVNQKLLALSLYYDSEKTLE